MFSSYLLRIHFIKHLNTINSLLCGVFYMFANERIYLKYPKLPIWVLLHLTLFILVAKTLPVVTLLFPTLYNHYLGICMIKVFMIDHTICEAFNVSKAQLPTIGR